MVGVQFGEGESVSVMRTGSFYVVCIDGMFLDPAAKWSGKKGG